MILAELWWQPGTIYQIIFLELNLDEFVVMPNHIHAIIAIVGAGSKPARSKSLHGGQGIQRQRAGLEPAPTGIKLSEIIRQLKTFSARRINKIRQSSSYIWQRNYYEHIIRNEKDHERICEYIVNNPLQWAFDKESMIDAHLS